MVQLICKKSCLHFTSTAINGCIQMEGYSLMSDILSHAFEIMKQYSHFLYFYLARWLYIIFFN